MEITPDHPVYVEDKGWLNAENLAEGDRLRRADGGYATVLAVERVELDEPQEVYNFTVKGPHTYFVLEVGVLVHNNPSVDCGRVTEPVGLDKAFPEAKDSQTTILGEDVGNRLKLLHEPLETRRGIDNEVVDTITTHIKESPSGGQGYVVSGVSKDKSTFYAFNVRRQNLPKKFKHQVKTPEGYVLNAPMLTSEGTPLTALGRMSQMKALGIEPGSLNRVVLSRVQNFETAAQLTKYAKTNKIPLEQLLQDPKELQKALYQSKIVQFNETVVTQWGHKIKVDTIKIEGGEFKSVGPQLKAYEGSTNSKGS